jgi:hypothetical protein
MQPENTNSQTRPAIGVWRAPPQICRNGVENTGRAARSE